VSNYKQALEWLDVWIFSGDTKPLMDRHTVESVYNNW